MLQGAFQRCSNLVEPVYSRTALVCTDGLAESTNKCKPGKLNCVPVASIQYMHHVQVQDAALTPTCFAGRTTPHCSCGPVTMWAISSSTAASTVCGHANGQQVCGANLAHTTCGRVAPGGTAALQCILPSHKEGAIPIIGVRATQMVRSINSCGTCVVCTS